MYDFYNAEGGQDDLKPDGRSFNTVINAVARSRDPGCADRAKHLLDEMGRLFDEGNEDLLPDALTFGAIINAYANSFEEGASDMAAQLLQHMESLSQFGFDKARPTTFVYNACINAYAKDPQMSCAEKAEQLLTSMEKRYDDQNDYRIQPDCISYSTVINAHANNANVNSGKRADEILRRMTHRYLLGDTKCRPNAIAFTATIKAHSVAINATIAQFGSKNQSAEALKSIEASAKRCEDLLQNLCHLHLHQLNRSLKPTQVTYDLVLTVLSQAKDWDGVERVKNLRSKVMKQPTPRSVTGRAKIR